MSSNVDFAMVAPGADGYRKDHPCAEHQVVIDGDAGLASLSRKKIAIIGFASSSRHRVPWDDPEWSLWGLNQIYRHGPRFDRHFDIHLNWREDNVEGTDHPRWLRECGIPVFMADLKALAPEPREAYPTVCQYPVDRLIEKHGIDYFTSTVAFMLALAIDEIDRAAAKQLGDIDGGLGDAATANSTLDVIRSVYGEYTIGIFGIDLIVGTEYDWQKSCAEFWLGVAEGRGINVYLPPETALCKQQYRYGYQKEPGTGLIALSELQRRHLEIEAQKAGVLQKVYALRGAMDWLRAAKARPELDLDKELADLEAEYFKGTALAQTLDGAQQENNHVRTVLELRLRGGKVPLGNAA